MEVGFQFLIGRLDTRPDIITKAALAEFQFLIGRLDTVASLAGVKGGSMFQFLIGRLDTVASTSPNSVFLGFNSS